MEKFTFINNFFLLTKERVITKIRWTPDLKYARSQNIKFGICTIQDQ